MYSVNFIAHHKTFIISLIILKLRFIKEKHHVINEQRPSFIRIVLF